MKSKLVLSLILGLAVLTAGCMSVSVHSKVNKDGYIQNYKIVVNTSSMVYAIFAEQAKKEGYSSLREYFIRGAEEDVVEGTVSYNEVWKGDSVSLIIEVKDVKLKPGGKLKITKVGDYLIYEDLSFKSEKSMEQQNEISRQMLSTISLHYYLEMPGKIVESNANVIKENKAEWHLMGMDAFNARIYAKSEIPKLPGFELLTGIMAFAIVFAIGFRKRRK